MISSAFEAVNLSLFEPGATETAIDQRWGTRVPPSLRGWLRLVNGQRGQRMRDSALGHFSFYDSVIAFFLPSLRRMSAPNVAATIVGTWRREVFVSGDGSTICCGFKLASSWPDFVENLATKVRNNILQVTFATGLRLFPLLGIPTAETEGIIVSASPLFVPMQSGGGQYVFTYSIRIRGNPNLKFSARLASREWRIFKGEGPVEVVRGPGVVGKG